MTPGRVWLVGAGPGDPELITVRGLRALREADVVVYDRLVAPELLGEAGPGTLLLYAGKEPGGRRTSQERIMRLLIEHARAGRRVVRLKGGDPYVFGRGGEEAERVARAGIPVTVVPGVTSAVAVPAAAGIPLSHRDLASSIAIVTAQRRGGAEPPWASLCAIDTVVFLMGADRVEEISRRLIAAGRSPGTPAAAVRWGTTDRQRQVIGTLAGLPRAFAEGRMGPPVVIVVGEVVALAGRLGRGVGEVLEGDLAPELEAVR